MDDMITTLVERVEGEQWPPLAASGADVRRRGRRRRLQHRVAYVGGVGAVAVGLVAVPLSVSRWQSGTTPQSPAAGVIQHQGDGVVQDLFGVEITLPPGWKAEEIQAPTGQRQACLGPDPVEPPACAAIVSVTTDPERADQNGIDVADLLAQGCAPTDLEVLLSDQYLVDGRNAHDWTSSCPDDAAATRAWALDNRTFAVSSGNVQWDDDARFVFEQARTPTDWPHVDSVYSTAETGG